MTCKAIRQGDQMQCSVCGLAWDVNDADRPQCVPGASFNSTARRLRSEWQPTRHSYKYKGRRHD